MTRMSIVSAFKSGYREAMTGEPDAEYERDKAAREAQRKQLRQRLQALKDERAARRRSPVA
jgi:hypothetical protein